MADAPSSRDADFLPLLKSANAGDANAEALLCERNLPLVYAIAKRYRDRGVDMGDLVQLGSMGLVKAIRRFDPSFGVQFSTYAVPLIAGEIKRFLRDDGAVAVPRSAKALAARAAALLQEGEDLGVAGLAEKLMVSPEELAMALASRETPLSIDAAYGEEDAPLLAFLGTDSEEEKLLDQMTVNALLERLPPREALILRLRYYADLTQAEIAARLGLSQVQISRLIKRSLGALRSG